MMRDGRRRGRSWPAVALVASLLAVPTTASAALPYEDAVRIDASSPRAAAIAVSRELYGAGQAGAVVLARQDTFPDALGASALTTEVDGPLLLTPPTRLASDTRAEIDRVLADGGTVYLLGGTVALAPAVEQALDDLGYRTPRFAGRDRVETAALIARFVGPGPSDTALLVRASGNPDLEQGWVDSVSCGGYAANTATPVLLTQTGSSSVAAETRRTLDRLGIRRVHVCGGPLAVPDAQLSELRGAGFVVERHAGEDRAATAVAVATELWGATTRAGRDVLLVPGYGRRFGYGLVAAPLSAAMDAPILLVDRDTPTSCSDDRGGATLCYLRTGDGAATSVIAVGGTGVVSDDVLVAAARAADLSRDTTPPAVPTGLTVTDRPEDDGTLLEIDWDPVGEAGVTYTLYIRRADDGETLTRSNSLAMSGTRTERVVGALKPGVEYDMAVDARDEAGNRSKLSTVVTGVPTDEVPASPGDQGPTLETVADGIAVSWVAAPEADVVGYDVQRLDASPALLEGTDCDPDNDFNPADWTDVDQVAATSLVDADVESGTSYCYRYRPVDSTDNTPDWSRANGPQEAP